MKLEILLDILKNSLKENFSGKIWKYLVGSSGALIAILLFGRNFFGSSVSISIWIGLCFLTFLFLLRLLLFLSKNIFKYLHTKYREAKYGDAIIFLKNAFSKVHRLRQKDNFTDQELMETLKYLCDQLKELFDNKNMCDCFVSIKVAVDGNIKEDTSLKNLCRDSTSSKIRDTPNYNAIDHTIIGNTAFIKVLNNVLRKNKKGFFYLNNSINKNDDYENTSKELYEGGILPYNSEIVVPIIPARDEQINEYNILGFLCVDCRLVDKFDKKYDPTLIEGVAEGIYDVLQKRKN